MAEQTFDLVVIGGGPGGYVAAIRAAQLGMKTAIVEREHLGGICLNWGCIPTKALLRTSKSTTCCITLGEFGFAADNRRFDLAKSRRALARGRQAAIERRRASDEEEQDRRCSTATAKLAGKGTLAVAKDGKTVADTARAAHHPRDRRARAPAAGPRADGKLIWTYKEAMVPQAMPKSLLVVGSGAIGIEFASFYRNMGAEVTVVEVLDRVLPVEDEEISAFARKAFEKQGMKILTGATVKKLEEGRRQRHRDDRGGRQDAGDRPSIA